MANQLRQQIEQISREKNINPEVIIAAIEDAILTASKKYYKGAEDLRSRFNEESGQIEVFAVKQVVETVEIPETQVPGRGEVGSHRGEAERGVGRVLADEGQAVPEAPVRRRGLPLHQQRAHGPHTALRPSRGSHGRTRPGEWGGTHHRSQRAIRRRTGYNPAPRVASCRRRARSP